MAVFALTSLAWMLLIIGAVATGNADENDMKLAIGLWFATAIGACLSGAWYYAS